MYRTCCVVSSVLCVVLCIVYIVMCIVGVMCYSVYYGVACIVHVVMCWALLALYVLCVLSHMLIVWVVCAFALGCSCLTLSLSQWWRWSQCGPVWLALWTWG